MESAMDVVAALDPALRLGERISVRCSDRELLGFVVAVEPDAVVVLVRRGTLSRVARSDIRAVRRVGVALGSNPLRAPRSLLDALAEDAGVAGEVWVGRLSSVLARRTPPASAPPWGTWTSIHGTRVRFEGTWVTLGLSPRPGTEVEAVVVGAAWWATRQGARSVHVRWAAAEAWDEGRSVLTRLGLSPY